MPETEIEEVFPELEGIPLGLNVQIMHEVDAADPTGPLLARTDFVNWVQTGGQTCDLAAALMQNFVADRNSGRKDETLVDFFDALLYEYAQEGEDVTDTTQRREACVLPATWLAQYMLRACTLPC